MGTRASAGPAAGGVTLGTEDAWAALHGCKVFLASSGEEVSARGLQGWAPELAGMRGDRHRHPADGRGAWHLERQYLERGDAQLQLFPGVQ